MKVKIKKLNKNAVIPKYANFGDAGMDLIATHIIYDEYGNVVYGTGLAFEIPKGYVGLIFPRSSNSKQDLLLSNSVGIIDSGYRGEILFKFKPTVSIVSDKDEPNIEFEWIPEEMSINFANDFKHYQKGDRIGQIIILPYPEIEFEEVQELSETERGEDGFGSTGN